MDVTKLLEQDHRTVEGLFSQYQSSPSDEIAQRICQELEIHTSVEEQLVYPRLADIDPELERHAEEEHMQAKELISSIRSGSGDVSDLMAQLESAVQEHVQEEETRAFPELRQQLGNELEQLGNEVQQRKQEMMSRPQ
jgi:hemerythrin superfamily protein